MTPTGGQDPRRIGGWGFGQHAIGLDPLEPTSPTLPSPCTMVLFGATGDLTRRKLIPAIYSLYTQGLLPRDFEIVAVARRQRTVGEYRSEAFESVQAYAPAVPASAAAWQRFAEHIHYVCSSLESPSDLDGLKETLEHVERSKGTQRNRLFYLATPPDAFARVVEILGATGLSTQASDGIPWRRVIIEKPFGRDLVSARELNRRLRATLTEDQIYRIDHYLGKETVQNIMVMRFANRLFELLWNHLYVDNVQITVAETLGMEGRGGYFDASGIVRDIIQNHALQVLSLVAMEPPVTLSADAVRDEKVKVLRAIRIPREQDIVWAQYGAGVMNGAQVPAYKEEPGVASTSRTETYCAIRFFVDNWRWAGVPFYVRAGKRLARRLTEVSLELRPVPDVLYSRLTCAVMPPNRISIRIQPDEGVDILMGAKEPGVGMCVQPVRMRFSYAEEFGRAIPDAYERLILNALLGDASLFARDDEVDTAWEILTPALAAWERSTQPPATYMPGSWGPVEADLLLSVDGRRWWNTDT